MIKNVFCSSGNVQLFLCDFKDIWNVPTVFSKNAKISDFMKIRPEGVELFHADGRTVMMKLIVAFRKLAILFSSGFTIRTLYAPLPSHYSCFGHPKIFDENYSGLILCIVTLCNKLWTSHNGGSKQRNNLNTWILITFQLSFSFVNSKNSSRNPVDSSEQRQAS